MHLGMPAIQLCALLKNMFMDILYSVDARQTKIRLNPYLTYEQLNYENGLLRSWNKQHGCID